MIDSSFLLWNLVTKIIDAVSNAECASYRSPADVASLSIEIIPIISLEKDRGGAVQVMLKKFKIIFLDIIFWDIFR